jgi:hypothetical protein
MEYKEWSKVRAHKAVHESTSEEECDSNSSGSMIKGKAWRNLTPITTRTMMYQIDDIVLHIFM